VLLLGVVLLLSAVLLLLGVVLLLNAVLLLGVVLLLCVVLELLVGQVELTVTKQASQSFCPEVSVKYAFKSHFSSSCKILSLE